MSVSMVVPPEGSLFWSWLTKKPAENNLAKSMNYWNHVLWSDDSKVNLFDSDGVQHMWWRPGEEYQENCALPTVKHGGGCIMVWGCMTTAGTGEVRFIEGNMDSNMYCDILNQKMMSSLQKMFSNITTPNTPPRWQLPCCWRWRWWSGQVCLQTWTLLSTCGASSGRSWRSTMCLTSSSLSLRRHAHGPLAKRLLHMVHLSGNASSVSKLSSDWLDYAGFVCCIL